MKKIFENAVWWSGVIMVGLILGISLQFVRAWTEPTAAPPGGNVGAPINTSILMQIKTGILGVAGLVTNSFTLNGTPPPGYVLTAQETFPGSGVSNGTVAWAPPSGSSSASGSQQFISSGDWTCPAGVTDIKVTAIGGGAGGGLSTWTEAALGGGGGSGGYTSTYITSVPGSTYTISLGDAGSGSNGSSNGYNGGSTKLKLGSTVLASADGSGGGSDYGNGGGAGGGGNPGIFGGSSQYEGTLGRPDGSGAGGAAPSPSYGSYGAGGSGSETAAGSGQPGFLIIEW